MTNWKVLLGALAFWVFCYSPSNAEPTDFVTPGGNGVIQHQISDDGAAAVPLTFGFPFYGTVYYYSWMHSNGVVSLVGINQGPPSSFCCSGVDLTTTNPRITNFIAPLWTDLIQADADGGFYTQAVDTNGDGTPDSMRYLWNRIEEFYNANNENSFGVELFSNGKIDMHHWQINLNGGHVATIGIVGDPSIGQYLQFGNGGANQLNTTTYTNTYSGTPEFDLSAVCASNPLYTTACPGYADAYALFLFQQQCSANPLYDSACPGYAQAYFTQQCSLNPLYDSSCPGYAQAYFDQQCSLNPLYDTACSGYAQAYFDQQCSLDGLYDTSCPNYAQAYFDQQCSLDALYDSACPGYDVAYFNTYVKPELEKQAAELASQTETTSTPTTTSPTTVTGGTDTGSVVVTASGVQDPVATATNVSVSGDATVDEVVRNNTTAPVTTTTVEPTTTATTDVAQNTTTVSQSTTEEKQEEKKTEEAVAEVVASVDEKKEEEKKDDKKSAPKTTEQQRKEKIKELVANRAQSLADKMSEAATIEAQQDMQNQVLALMGFNPDFTAYQSSIIPQPVGYNQPQMPDAKLPKNSKGLRNGLAQQMLHEKMIDMQYNK